MPLARKRLKALLKSKPINVQEEFLRKWKKFGPLSIDIIEERAHVKPNYSRKLDYGFINAPDTYYVGQLKNDQMDGIGREIVNT